MIKIKVIDLLNKIANGEEVPKKIKHNRLIYNWDIVGYLHYEDEEDTEKAFLEGYRTDMCLNDEVEIIEENKKIEPFTEKEMKVYHDMSAPIDDLVHKVSLIIDHINKE